MDASFKTCMFGGFDREDVVAFIEKTAEDTRAQLEALQAENESLRQERDEAAAQRDALYLAAEEGAHLREENQQLTQRLEVLEAEAAALRAEAASLRYPASEYQSLKDHIADIEINAHRRTAEFRAKALERLAECIAQQRAWCSQRRSTYLNLNATLLEQLRRAEEEVESADYTAFDDMLLELQQLDQELRQDGI